MKYTYNTHGTCSRVITFDINDNIITNVEFVGGCPGNLKAISKLVEGMSSDEIINKLSGIKCGVKNTSCSDQLAMAVKQACEELNK